MTDVREAILARLLVVCSEVEGILNAFRNKASISENMQPALAIYDADEEGYDDPKGRPTIAHRRVLMTPQIVVLHGAAASEVGTDVNVLRARVIKAIMTDAALAALTLDREGVRYEGCTTELAMGRQMNASFGISISFTYMLKPADL